MGCTISVVSRPSSSFLSQLRNLKRTNDPEYSTIPKEIIHIEHLGTTPPQATSPNNLKSNTQIQVTRRESTGTTSTILSCDISPSKARPTRRESTVSTSTILSSPISPSQTQRTRRESIATASSIYSTHISPNQQQRMTTLIQELLQSLKTYESL